MDTFTIILNVIVGIAFILAIIGWLLPDKDDSYDFMHDYFGLPKEYDLPDEITVEIVKEKPAGPVPSSDAQNETSVLPSTAQAAASDDASGPKGKGGYLPE